MKYRLFGKSGLRVSELCLGVMTFGEEWGYGSGKKECQNIFDTFAEAGGNFFDTADNYTEGTSEKWLGEFIARDREHFVIATKYSMATRTNDVAFCGNNRKHMTEALNASLKRLNTDYIDLYWIHAWDFTTPVEEVMRALDDAVRAGKILYVGVSNTPAWLVARANTIAEFRGWTPFTGMQIQYSLLKRTSEREYLPMAGDLDLGVVAWQPLGGSVLTGNVEELNIRLKNYGAGPADQAQLAIVQVVMDIAREIGKTPPQVALNWVRQQQVPIIPIMGARLASHVKDNLGCLDFTLSAEHMKRLGTASKIDLGYPYDMLKGNMPRIYGGAFPSIDNHRKWPPYLSAPMSALGR